MIECLTDNRNRAATEVRLAVTRNGGTMADPGSVAYNFTRKGVFVLPKGELTEDDLLMAVLDAGAEEVNDHGDTFEVISDATDFQAVRTALLDASIEYDSAEPAFVANVDVPLDLEGARKLVKLLDAIEDLDDTQNVVTNADIPDDVAAQLDEE
jgi:YebC/PmpR family DNA-binding regulatory protein